MVRRTDRPAMTIAVDLGRKATKPTKEPIFYGDLVYKFKRIAGKPNFSDQFKKIIKYL